MVNTPNEINANLLHIKIPPCFLYTGYLNICTASKGMNSAKKIRHTPDFYFFTNSPALHIIFANRVKQLFPLIQTLSSVHDNIFATSSARLSSRFWIPSPRTKYAKPANLPPASSTTCFTVLDGSITNGCSSKTVSA